MTTRIRPATGVPLRRSRDDEFRRAIESNRVMGATRTTQGTHISRRRQLPDTYWGPFAVSLIGTAYPWDTIKVSQGYVYAGSLAYADFPNTYNGNAYAAGSDLYDITLLATGAYLLLMDIPVVAATGIFDGTYHPELNHVTAANFTALNTASIAQIILADFHVTNTSGTAGVVDHIQQRWHGDIYVPVSLQSSSYLSSLYTG